MKSFLCLSLILLFVFVGCKKHRAKKLAGTYDCTVLYSYWTMGSEPEDSTYKEQLVVVASGKNITVFNTEIPVEEFAKGKAYSVKATHTSFYLKFKDDKIYLRSESGGLGGGGSKTYSGKKIKD